MAWVAALRAALIMTLGLAACPTAMAQADQDIHNQDAHIRTMVQSLAEQSQGAQSLELESMEFLNPMEGGVFPADFAPPLFLWRPAGFADEHWLLRVATPNGQAWMASDQPSWRPDPGLWQAMRSEGLQDWVTVEVYAFDQDRPAAMARTTFKVSPDPFAAKVMVQRIPLPFLTAQDHPELSSWLLADPSSPEPPLVLLADMPHCGNCHTVSRDGSTLGMDIDYNGDKGGYLLTLVRPEVAVGPETLISWSGYRPDIERTSMGLFTKLSTDGRYALTTVKEQSLFIRIDHEPFSQLFFPIRGHLAFYDRQTAQIRPLPGADREDLVQTSPDLSPDGEYVVFARADLDPDLLRAMGDKKFLPAQGRLIDELNTLYPYRFDLWRMPFDQGRGGVPQPLAGASANGMSNYFPRYSPDGRWIVYCQAPTGLVLQPGSRLWIVPAQGGQARALECNTELFNSWHSFTPNGRWIVFSAKAVSHRTQVMAAHLDQDGHASGPVLLDRLYDDQAAYIIPEAVPQDLALRSIRLPGDDGRNPSTSAEKKP